jgi:thioredoxin 1
MPMIELSPEELKNLDNIGFSLLQFYGTWCGPCKLLKVEIDKVLEEMPALNVLRYDIDKDIDLAHSFGIKGIPVLFILKDKEIISRQTGFMPKEKISD